MDKEELKIVNDMLLNGLRSRQHRTRHVTFDHSEVTLCLAMARLTGLPLMKSFEAFASAKEDMTVTMP